MSVPHALEAAHNTLVSKYKENEATIRSLRKTLREDIIPNVLDEMNEEETQHDMQDLEDWANDTGVNIRMNKRTMVITPPDPRICLSYPQGLFLSTHCQSRRLRHACAAS